MDDQLTFPGMDAEPESSGRARLERPERADLGPVRLRLADRQQVRMIARSLDEMLHPEHQARVVWLMVDRLDLSDFKAAIAARGSEPGRPATDPHILIALWLYASLEGIGSGRELTRLCEAHDAYRWIVGGVSLNYHTINDFRVDHGQALDALFTQVIALLVKQGLVDVTRLTQDGVRVRASAGTSSFRRESSLTQLQADARAHLEALKTQNDPAWSARQQARQLADAQDRQNRLDEALRQLPLQQAAQALAARRSGLDQPREARISTTDPDARRMKIADGGYRPAYNVQLAADPTSRAIVGVDVTNQGTDGHLDEPMRQQVEQRTGQKVKEHLVDGGYAVLDAIDQAEANGVTIYAPVKSAGKSNADPHARKPKDTDHTFAWRQRMAGEEAKAIYRQRAATIETVNADLTEHRGLRQFPVRGSPKVRCVALWLALAYNILHFGPTLIAAANLSS
jgi:transposase